MDLVFIDFYICIYVALFYCYSKCLFIDFFLYFLWQRNQQWCRFSHIGLLQILLVILLFSQLNPGDKPKCNWTIKKNQHNLLLLLDNAFFSKWSIHSVLTFILAYVICFYSYHSWHFKHMDSAAALTHVPQSNGKDFSVTFIGRQLWNPIGTVLYSVAMGTTCMSMQLMPTPSSSLFHSERIQHMLWH